MSSKKCAVVDPKEHWKMINWIIEKGQDLINESVDAEEAWKDYSCGGEITSDSPPGAVLHFIADKPGLSDIVEPYLKEDFEHPSDKNLLKALRALAQHAYDENVDAEEIWTDQNEDIPGLSISRASADRITSFLDETLYQPRM